MHGLSVGINCKRTQTNAFVNKIGHLSKYDVCAFCSAWGEVGVVSFEEYFANYCN